VADAVEEKERLARSAAVVLQAGVAHSVCRGSAALSLGPPENGGWVSGSVLLHFDRLYGLSAWIPHRGVPPLPHIA
jgi:hypothetical protein